MPTRYCLTVKKKLAVALHPFNNYKYTVLPLLIVIVSFTLSFTSTERGYSDEEEEGEFSSVEEADEMTYGAPARRRPHRQIEFNKADMSYTKVGLHTYILTFLTCRINKYIYIYIHTSVLFET